MARNPRACLYYSGPVLLESLVFLMEWTQEHIDRILGGILELAIIAMVCLIYPVEKIKYALGSIVGAIYSDTDVGNNPNYEGAAINGTMNQTGTDIP